MEVLSLVPLLGFALGWQRYQKTTAAAAMLHAVAAMMMVLYLGALIGLLSFTTMVLMASGGLLAAIEIGRHLHQRAPLPVPVGIFLIFCVVYWAIQSNSLYAYYDEYSHWGVFLKETLGRNQLWGADTNSLHPQYLPGATLWQYFFAVYSKKPEGAAFLAQFTLLLTPLLVLFENIRWRQAHWLLGILAFIIIAVSNFGHGLTSIYVDHLLGAWFAGILLNLLLEIRSRSMWQLTSYLLPLAVLVLIKSTGVFFALACTGTIALLLVFHPDLQSTKRWTVAWLRRVAVFPVAATFLFLFVLVAWHANRNALSIADTGVSTSTVTSRVLSRESTLDAEQKEELSRRFVEILLHQQISKNEISAQYNEFSYQLMPLYKEKLRLTTASFLGLSLIAFFLLWKNAVAVESRRYWAIAALCTWLTAVAYIGGLLLGYLYVSAIKHSYDLPSYIRYAHSMLLPVLLFVFAGLVPAFTGRRPVMVAVSQRLTVGRPALLFFSALVLLAVVERPYLEPLYTPRRPPALRLQLEPFTEQVRGAIGETRLWVFFPNNVSNGFVGQLLQFQLSPGRTYVEEDAGVLMDDQDALKDELQNWEYAWFAPQNPDFDAALARLLDSEVTSRVFRIDASGDTVKLNPVMDVFRNPAPGN